MFEGCSSFDMEQPYQVPLIANPSLPWLHTPPAQMPWSIPIANQPSVMRFTGDRLSPTPDVKETHAKRKIWDTEIEQNTPPVKQLITEEKMAENMNGLHISSSYVSHQIGSNQPVSIPLPGVKPVEPADSSTDSSSLSSVDLSVDGKDRTVSLCEQLRKLISETSVIPAPLLNKVERPCNALVLWQPPGGSIFKSSDVSSSSEGETKQPSDEESMPSTSGFMYPRSPAQSTMGWSDLMDNNNSSNAMDLNLFRTRSSSSSPVLPSDVPLPDDSMMDF